LVDVSATAVPTFSAAVRLIFEPQAS